jgi:hypothetical protein
LKSNVQAVLKIISSSLKCNIPQNLGTYRILDSQINKKLPETLYFIAIFEVIMKPFKANNEICSFKPFTFFNE